MSDLKQYRITAAERSGARARRSRRPSPAARSRPGERLPSVRRLAAEVGLSPVTVAAGLAELRRRGVVLTEPRRGTRIGEGPPVGSLRAPLPVPPGARDLSRGNPDPALLPDLRRALARSTLPDAPLWRAAGAARAARARARAAARRRHPGRVAVRRQRRARRRSSACCRRTCAPATASPSRTPATRRCSTCCAPTASLLEPVARRRPRHAARRAARRARARRRAPSCSRRAGRTRPAPRSTRERAARAQRRCSRASRARS